MVQGFLQYSLHVKLLQTCQDLQCRTAGSLKGYFLSDFLGSFETSQTTPLKQDSRASGAYPATQREADLGPSFQGGDRPSWLICCPWELHKRWPPSRLCRGHPTQVGDSGGAHGTAVRALTWPARTFPQGCYNSISVNIYWQPIREQMLWHESSGNTKQYLPSKDGQPCWDPTNINLRKWSRVNRAWGWEQIRV